MRALVSAIFATVCFAEVSRAEYTYTFQEVGNNVVETGVGTLDPSNFYLLSNHASQSAFVDASEGYVAAGPVNGLVVEYLANIDNSMFQSGPFGNGPFSFANRGRGDEVGLSYFYGGQVALVTVPRGYQSNTSLVSFSTFDNATFASLGLFPGDYTYTLAGDQVFELDIGGPAPVSEPSTSVLLVLPMGLLAISVRRQLTKSAAYNHRKIVSLF